MYKITKSVLLVTLLFTSISLIILLLMYIPKVGTYNYSETVSPDTKFKTCNLVTREFYQTNANYITGRYGIRQEIFSTISKLNYLNFSGNINIRFIINCNNEIGNFRIKATNQNFELVELTSDLKENIIHQVLKLKKWNNTEQIDSYYQINIKIRNGEVKDLF